VKDTKAEDIVDAGPPAPPPYAFSDDGDDDADEAEDLPTRKLGSHLTLTKVGTAPNALTRVCDLTSFKGSLYAAHANQPLGTDGATITRYSKDTGKFAIAFDWNRPGEPTKGGGGGQGFLRVHKFNGRLYVADADPPYNGLAMVEYGTEGYVFVSDEAGKFAGARMPNFKPPLAPDANGKAGASVLPRAYHVIDVMRFGSEFFASTGSVPPTERAWHGPSPGALHRARPDLSRFVYDVDYPYPYQNGVWRLTYMTRFHGRLYAGIQDYDGREPNDYVYFTPDAADSKSVGDLGDAGMDRLAQNRTRLKAFRVSDSGAAETLRWRVDQKTHTLYWIAWTRDGVNLRGTRDGDTWETIEIPASAGRPTDIRRFGEELVILAERALLSLAPDGTTKELLHLDLPGAKDKKKAAFELSDFFCAAPLGIYKGQLYVGGQRGGTLYRIDEVPEMDADAGAKEAPAP
jgi:hypothetical protein